MQKGLLTGSVGEFLSKELLSSKYSVFFDHGDPESDYRRNIGRISSWFGDEYNARSQLAFIDIAIFEKDSNRVLALIEIEESSSNPKVILGDIFGTLMGDHISFKGDVEIRVGEFSALLVYIQGDEGKLQDKINHIESVVKTVKPSLNSNNAIIDHIKIRPYTDYHCLQSQLLEFIETRLSVT